MPMYILQNASVDTVGQWIKFPYSGTHNVKIWGANFGGLGNVMIQICDNQADPNSIIPVSYQGSVNFNTNVSFPVFLAAGTSMRAILQGSTDANDVNVTTN